MALASFETILFYLQKLFELETDFNLRDRDHQGSRPRPRPARKHQDQDRDHKKSVSRPEALVGVLAKNSYYFSVLNVNLHTVVRLFSIWPPIGVSWSLPFMTHHLSVQLSWPAFPVTNRLVPKVFITIEPTACVLTILSDLYRMLTQ